MNRGTEIYSTFIDESSYNLTSKILYEWGDDTLKSFQNNIKKYPNDEDLLTYKLNPIQYKLNNHGYRSGIDFTEGLSGNVYLGDSHTVGIGHYFEDTWAYKLNQKIGGNFINLAEGGEGIGSGFRKLLTYIDYFNVKNVFINYPHHYRYEYWFEEKRKYYTLRPTQQDMYQPWFGKLHKMLLAEERNNLFYISSNFYALIGLCKSKNIPVYAYSKELAGYHIYGGRKARDLSHAPIGLHDEIAKEMYEKYNNNQQADLDTQADYILREISSIQESKNKWTKKLY